MLKLKAIVIMCACLMLISCASGTQPQKVLIQQLPLNIEQAYLVECEKLPLLKDGKPSSALINYTKTAQLYHECAARQNALSNAVELHNNTAKK